MRLLNCWFVFFLTLYTGMANAQCINTFPYTQDFEATNGNWASGGTGDDWTWGQVSKSVIQQAASGNNCWVVGGLTNSFYNFNERSYLQSPCFNFTNVQAPYISFQIFWDTENTYDGTNLQYSTDGITWINIGAYNEQPDCITENWYNNSNISNLTNLTGVKEGWSGNTQNTQGSCQGGNGSNGWKLAKHCLSNLAGLPQVFLRFTFGAGTTCNDYDGVAIDDITIASAAAAAPNFIYTCNGNTVSFSAPTITCSNNLQWSFGDGTGATGLTANHTFTTGGIHNVSLTITGLCGATYSTTKPIEILEVNTLTIPVSCAGGNNGMAIVQPPGIGPFSYEWGTNPVQTTDTAFNLVAGTYTVTVNATGVCAGVATAVINDGANIFTDLTIEADTCNLLTGSSATNPSGGIPPYQYQWSNGSTNTAINNVAAGPYQLTLTDANGCSVSVDADVPYTSGLVLQVALAENVSCFGSNDGKTTIEVNGGEEPYTYAWSNNKNTAAIDRLPEGVYTLTVTDSRGCLDSTQIVITKEQCESYVDFPTAFSPNGDGVNDVFRARYSPDVTKFAMRIYNRWGELVYAIDDILDGWNGTYKNIAQPMGTFVWVAEFSFLDGSRKTTSGNVTLLR